MCSAQESPLQDLVHAIANLQTKLNEKFFASAIGRVRAVREADPSAAPATTDDLRAMVVELVTVVACAAGLRVYYDAAGLQAPAFPDRLRPSAPARFGSVVEYAPTGLRTNSKHAWGPFLLPRDVRPEVFQSIGLKVGR